MAVTTYDVDDQIRLGSTFKINTTPTDPTVITFTYRPPTGASVTFTHGVDAELNKSGTGVYFVDLIVTSPGQWAYRWKGTGTVNTAEQAELNVREENPV